MTAAKPKVAFYWCAGCGGCEEAVVDLDERLLDVAAAVDIVFWPVALDFKRGDVERLPDGAITAAFVNGGIRTSEHEEMARLLRAKSQVLIAFGACAQAGGIPALANLWTPDAIFDTVYLQSPSLVNPDRTMPVVEWGNDGHHLELPVFQPAVRPLADVVGVDYFLPGCPPPTSLVVEALGALLGGTLPPPGAVLAPDHALCETCPRRDSKPADLSLHGFRRPHEVVVNDEQCLLAQGLACQGAVTRGGCEARCVSVNMPCTGCMGPMSRVRDMGAKSLSALASVLDARDDETAEDQAAALPDPVGTFYRYGLAASLLRRRGPGRSES